MSITVTGVQKNLPDELPLRDLRRLRECFDDYAVDASEVAEAMAVEVPEPADGEDGDGVEPSSSSPPGGEGFAASGPVIDAEGVTAALADFGLRSSEETVQRLVRRSFEDAVTADDTGLHVDYKEFLVLARNVYASPRMYGGTLRRAAGRGEVDTVRALLDRGCDPNCRDGNGWTTVMHAAAYARDEVIELLKEHQGAALVIDARDVSGHTPFLQAAASGHIGTCRLLKSLGAKTDAVSNEGRNALHLAASRGQDASIKFLLSEGGLKADAVDCAGWSALHCATIHGHASCAKLLVTKHSKLTEGKDVTSASPIDYANAKGLNDTAPDPIMLSVLERKKKKK